MDHALGGLLVQQNKPAVLIPSEGVREVLGDPGEWTSWCGGAGGRITHVSAQKKKAFLSWEKK